MRPSKEDDYICTGVSLAELAPNKNLWVTKFEAVSQGNRAHHMIISRCKNPVKTKPEATWDCAHHAMCKAVLSRIVKFDQIPNICILNYKRLCLCVN